MKPHKLRPMAFLLALAVFTSGCMVRSVYPWLKKENFIFEENLLGGWVGTGDRGDVAMTFVRGADGSYDVQYSDKENRGAFEGNLAKFGSDYYLDFRPKTEAPGLEGLLLFPTHSAARLEIGEDTLIVHPLNYGAFTAAAKLDRLRDLQYAWGDKKEDELVIVSGTGDMQRFLISLAHNSDLYSPPIKLARKK